MDVITILTWIVCSISISLTIYQTVFVQKQAKKIRRQLKRCQRRRNSSPGKCPFSTGKK